MLGYLSPHEIPGIFPRDWFQRLSTRSGMAWLDATGDTARLPLASRCLAVSESGKLDLPADTASVTVVGTVAGEFTADDQRWAASTAGRIYRLDTFDALGLPLDRYLLGEGSGSTLYSVLRANATATLGEGITWDYQTQYPNPGNSYGYRDVSGVAVPMLLDRTAYADGSPLGSVGSHPGKVAWPGAFVDAQCVDFGNNDANGYFRASAVPAPLKNSSAFTVSFWVKIETNGRFISSNYTGTTDAVGFVIGDYPAISPAPATTRGIHVSMRTSNGTVGRAIAQNCIDWGAWNLVTITFAGSLAEVQRIVMYVNGAAVSIAYNSGILASTSNNLTYCDIGKNSTYASITAQAARIHVYDRALSEAEALALYTSMTPPSGLVHCWPCCAGAGKELLDVVGTNRATAPAGFNETVGWGAKQSVYCYPLEYGYRVYSDGNSPARYVVVGRRMDGTWPTAPTGFTTLVGTYPALTDGWNGNPYIDICKLNLCPSYAGHLPAEMIVPYDTVEDRGAGGFPYGDYRDVSPTFAELLALRGETVDATLRRRLCVRQYVDGSGNIVGIDRLMHYSRQLTAREWARVLRYQRDRLVA